MPPSKNGSLGRGLGDLISGIPTTIGSAATISSTGFVRLSPDLIGLTPEQDARAQQVEGDLVESVRVHGVLQPILVRRRTQGYEVVVGARRLVAARLAGLKEIPAVIIQVTDEEGLELSKVENTCREHLNPVIPVMEPVGPVEGVGAKGYWTPVRTLLVCAAVLLLLTLGAGGGLMFGWLTNEKAAEASIPPLAPLAPELVVAPAPVVVEPSLAPKSVELDVTDLKELEREGVASVMESNSVAQVVFAAPLFTSRVTLAGDGAVILKKLGPVLIKHGEDWDVVVTGHTDTVPLRGNGLYQNNKELGLARATEVMRYLMREGRVPAAMLRAATAGEDHPPCPGDDADARRKNRTVTMQIRLRQ